MNLFPIIGKLEKLQADTSAKGTSLSSMLHDLADFREHDLPELIQSLYEQQRLADEMKTDLEQEIELLVQSNMEKEMAFHEANRIDSADAEQLQRH